MIDGSGACLARGACSALALVERFRAGPFFARRAVAEEFEKFAFVSAPAACEFWRRSPAKPRRQQRREARGPNKADLIMSFRSQATGARRTRTCRRANARSMGTASAAEFGRHAIRTSRRSTLVSRVSPALGSAVCRRGVRLQAEGVLLVYARLLTPTDISLGKSEQVFKLDFNKP